MEGVGSGIDAGMAEYGKVRKQIGIPDLEVGISRR